MGILQRFLPSYDPEGEKMKDKRVDDAVARSSIVEDRIKKLAALSQAARLDIKQVKHR